ncbi:DNA topology modulation protein FlaR [Bacillus sp. FJAT-18017]|uniref:AAA family ATPase n=1 Tax=Bacillus sp. FJAT-18017 TaxID=1705566 RepID=UPI0006AECE7A|nr:AAA family ATPase [Bacillus sp. FJAT-18017]ALC91774.1 DNA topology modulation protein FlaR [Bacillus sp. FJAT-18017]
MREVPRKIHIIGSVGSGKTTLAKKLSRKLNIPFYELDNVVHERSPAGDRRRSAAEAKDILREIQQHDTWIVEGVHNEDWVSESFERAEVIIFLDPSNMVKKWRITKRFARQKLRLEQSHYTPTWEIYFKMFKWNKHFEAVGKPNFFTKYARYKEKVLVVKGSKEVGEYF